MKLYSLLIAVLFFSVTLFAQEVVEKEFKVAGACDMCKSRIEKTVKVKGVKFAKWNKKEQTLKVAYDSTVVSGDELMKKVADVGHDNELYTAKDEVYEKLPGCCLYRELEVH